MIFQTPRLIVRQPDWADGDIFYILNSDPDVVRFIRPPRTRAEADEKLKERIEGNNAGGNGLGGWMVGGIADGIIIGTLGLFLLPDSDEVNLGYSLLKPFWGLGYATEMAVAAINYGFQLLHLPRIVATAFPNNIGSQKILAKCGFEYIGMIAEEGVELFKYELRP